MNRILRKFPFKTTGFVLAAAIGALGAPVHAQLNPEVANCEALRDSVTQGQIESCSAHNGCRMVLKLQKDCTKTKEFLRKLSEEQSGRKEITNDDVFEAAAPPVTGDPAFTQISQSLRSAFRNQAANVQTFGWTEKNIGWVYEGPMVDGKRHGTGVLVDSGGNLIRAEFVDGRQSGKGEYTDLQRRDVGDMQGFNLNGNGIRRHTDGQRYGGQFKADRPDGHGTVMWPSGSGYVGNFVNGERTGRGEYSWADGGQYVGDFVAGEMHGQGTNSSVDGNRYVGEFAHGKRHGQGVYTWASGGKFVGEFRDGNQVNGRETDAGGTVVAVVVNGTKSITGAANPPAASAAAPSAVSVAPSGANTTSAAPPLQGGYSPPGSPDYQSGRPSASTATGSVSASIGSPDYQPGRPSASTATGSVSASPGSPDYQPGRPSTPAASGSVTTAPRATRVARSCEDVLYSLFGPANDIAASAKLTPAQDGQSQVWVMQTYMRVANTHPACANDPQSRQKVAGALRSVQDSCRSSASRSPAGSYNCEAGQNYLGTAARTEAAIRQLFQETPAAGGPVASAPSVGTDCVAAIDRQEAEFRPISQRIANTPSAVGQMQLLMGMLSERMALLDQLCKGQPLYATYAGTKQQFDSSMRACRGIASNPSDCAGPQQPHPQQPQSWVCPVDANGNCLGYARGCTCPPGSRR